MIKKVLLSTLLISSFCVPGCEKSVPKKFEPEAHAAPDLPKSTEEPPRLKKIQLVFESVQVPPEYKAKFRFKNVDSEAVEIPGYSPPANGSFHPSFVVYEAKIEGKWETLPVFYDGAALMFDFSPGEECAFVIELWPFAKLQRPVTGRIKLNDRYYSEEFEFK